MYRHLLVPIENSDLSTVTISRAVEFALALGARITFFHASPDDSSSIMSNAEIVRMTAPDNYAYNFAGRAHELLTKAESAARAQGVDCGSISKVDDSPYQAIIAAAREAGCDLIYMATHGRRSHLGMILGSQTLKVLMNSDIPVLVSATKNPPASEKAIGIILDEHRSLSAVLHAVLHRLKEAIAEGSKPDPDLMRAIIYYLQTFPLALHHPKEDEYLFSKLRLRAPQFNSELDDLKQEHARYHELVQELSKAVERYCDGSISLDEVYKVLNDCAKFILEHMAREEAVVIPAAERHLTEKDWGEIHSAFSQNNDPRFGGDTDADYRQLFSRIVNLAANGKNAASNH